MFKSPYIINKQTLDVTTSMGISVYPEHRSMVDI